MRDADVDGFRRACGVRGGQPGRGQLPQRVPAAGELVHPGERLAIPKLARGRYFPGFWSTRRRAEGWALALGGGHVRPAGRLGPRRVEKLAASLVCHRLSKVAGQRDGRRAGRAWWSPPEPGRGQRPVHVFCWIDAMTPEGPRGRPDGERALHDRAGCERGRGAGDPRHPA